MRFEFATATRVVFGRGTLAEAGTIAAEFGRKALVVTGRVPERAARLVKTLEDAGVATVTYSFAGEPTVDTAREGVKAAFQAGCDLVVSFGGGAAIDAGKAIAMLVANGGDPLDYIEVIGSGQPITQWSAPFMAIPTTAGTGSEVTRNAVLASRDHKVKASLRSPRMLPRAALVDPELTLGLPPEITAGTGLDALTQLVEPYACTRVNPITDALCREGMARVARSLRRAFDSPSDLDAREDMALASLFGGIALANAGLGAVHGFAAVIGGLFPAPHGAVCARLLAPTIEMNARALGERAPGSHAVDRYADTGIILTGRPGAGVADAVAWIDDTCQALRVPGLAAYGMQSADIPGIVEQAARSSSTKANPIALTDAEMTEILEQAL
jgi:alcohol dehydrogenase class IV